MRFTSMSNRGGQVLNQDSFARACSNGIYCFVTVDGENPGGEFLSKKITDSIIKSFEKAPSVSAEAVEEYMNEAQRIAYETCEDELCGMAYASVAVLITDGTNATVAHIGDARVYRFEKHIIDFITTDHTDSMEKLEAGLITFEDIIKDKSELLRSFGAKRFSAEVEALQPVTRRTSFLVCTKGFWRGIDEYEKEEALRASASSKEWLGKMMKHMDGSLPHNCDNMTAAAIIM